MRRPDHLRDVRGPPGDRGQDFAGLDVAPVGVYPDHRRVTDFDVVDRGLLVDFRAPLVGAARVGPGHRVVSCDRARRMEQRPVDGWAADRRNTGRFRESRIG